MRALFLSTLIFVAFSFISFAQNWIPLEVGNETQFTKYALTRFSFGMSTYTYSFQTYQVDDSVFIEQKKYFRTLGFLDFPSNTLLRYDRDSSKLFINLAGIEYLYMDFSLPANSVINQIQTDGTIYPVTIISDVDTIWGEVLNLKGFSRNRTINNKAIEVKYFFAQEIGVVKKYEKEIINQGYQITTSDYEIIECRNLDSLGNIFHKKHSYSANIQFIPIGLLNFGGTFQQEFKITHPLSVKGFVAALVSGRTYLSDVYLDLYYSNEIDSGYNEQYPINSLSEVDFSVNYTIDILKYLNNYSLYYRIVAKDKGIVPSYYYKPATGYYKLVYSPSRHQVVFSEDSIYVPTLSDSGFTKIRNTSDFPVRIDSIISVGSFYGYHGNFSRPGFEYPFYFVQTAPGFTGDTLGIVIPPNDSINVSFSNIDLCPICDFEVQEYFKDTLRFVFTFKDGNVYSFSKSIPISGEGYPSDVEGEDVLPSKFVLKQNYPNPFNPNTSIQYAISSRQFVTLKVYDVLGNEIVTLVNEYRDIGTYETEFNANKFSSGVYYYQLRAGSLVQTKKMIYLK